MTTPAALPRWSPSRSETWRQCRWLYWLRYEARIAASQPTSPTLVHGRLVHAGIAAAYEAARQRPATGVMSRYREAACDAIDAYGNAGEPVTNRVRVGAIIEVEALLSMLPIPASGAILGIERPFRIVIDGVEIEGALDLALLTGPFSVHVRDWKTGHVPADLALHAQLGTYDRAARLLWPWARTVTVGLYQTRRHDEVTHEFDQESSQFVVDRLIAHQRDAEDAHAAVANGQPVVDVYPVRQSTRCASCSHRSFCPLFARATLPVRDSGAVEDGRARIALLTNGS